MDPIALLSIVGGIIGIIAGSVQVLDYVEKRRDKHSAIELVQPPHNNIETPSIVSKANVTLPELKPPLDANSWQYWGEALEVSAF